MPEMRFFSVLPPRNFSHKPSIQLPIGKRPTWKALKESEPKDQVSNQ